MQNYETMTIHMSNVISMYRKVSQAFVSWCEVVQQLVCEHSYTVVKITVVLVGLQLFNYAVST